jgi:hypothetical protein
MCEQINTEGSRMQIRSMNFGKMAYRGEADFR